MSSILEFMVLMVGLLTNSCTDSIIPIDSYVEVTSEAQILDSYGNAERVEENEILHVVGITTSNDWYIVNYNEQKLFLYSKSAKAITSEINGVPVSTLVSASEVPYYILGADSTCNTRFLYGIFQLTPDYVRDAIIYDGWTFIVTNEDLSKMIGSEEEIAGVTIRDQKTVYIENKSHTIKFSTGHEIGHIVDILLGDISNSTEFVNIYNEECSDFHAVGLLAKDFEESSPTEYFASAVNNIILTGDKYASSAPKTYEYVWRQLWMMKEINQ